MSLASALKAIEDAVEDNLDTLTPSELACLTVEAEQLRSKLEGLFSTVLASAKKRRAHTAHGHRSTSTWLAYSSSSRRSLWAQRVGDAERLHTHLPLVAAAVMDGSITFEHAVRLASLAGDPDLRESAVRDQQKLLGYAQVNTWPEFISAIKQWEVINDPTDPKDLDEKAFLDRRMIWARGLGKTMLIELNMPFEMFEALLTMMQPIYDKMRADDWKAAYGDQPIPDDGSFIDLGRSDRQRWLDALMQLVRQGALGGIADASVQTVVNILMDHTTFEQELARQAGVQQPLTLGDDAEENDTADEGEGLTPRRCETLSGLPLSPQSAFDAAIRGHIRRVVFTTGTLDFTMTSKTRLFTGPKRLGLIMRDRHCRGPGCDTPAHRCEGDHIREFSRGGDSVPINGEMLCGPCHRWKTKMQALGVWPEIVNLQQSSLQQGSLQQTENLRAA